MARCLGTCLYLGVVEGCAVARLKWRFGRTVDAIQIEDPYLLESASMRFVAILCPIMLTSCATIMSGSGRAVPIDSVPPGTTVSYRGANVGVTPCTVMMRARSSQLTLVQPGFHDQVVDVGTTFNGWFLGNILLGGLPGMLIDLLSGASSPVSTDPCWVELTPVSEPPPGVWTRDAARRQQSQSSVDDEGWIPEGGTKPRAVSPAKPGATRAPALKPPTPSM